MVVLGLSTFGQNPAAAILIDGRLIAFAEEERFVRVKGAFGYFPGNAVCYCLKEAGVPLSAVDRIAVGWDAYKYQYQMPLFFLSQWFRYGTQAKAASYGRIWTEVFGQRPGVIRERIIQGLRHAGLSGNIPVVEFVPHHLAHAASAYYASGFASSAILVVDGSGEERATSFFTGSSRTITEKGSINLPHSLGWFYAAITAYLGFTPYEEEGFVMGLAPYGKPNSEIREKLAQMVALEEGGYTVDPSYTLLGAHSVSEYFGDKCIDVLGKPRLPGEPITVRHKAIAYAAQELLEKAFVSLVRRVIEESGVRSLCLTGGVALNCKANGAVVRSGLIDDMFVQPAAHDAGAALGAAMVIADACGDDPRQRMTHARWGPGFTDDEIGRVLNETGARFVRPQSIAKVAAQAVSEGKIVAWFQGRMEVGPRALGGRSILADPTKAAMKDRINQKVKHRDMWRPFCPSISETSADKLFPRHGDTRFMTVTVEVPASVRVKIPAVVHVDGSTRPQTVSHVADPLYASLLGEVSKQSGLPAVLNTSLNVKGEPIARTTEDALRCFFSTGLDCLAIGNYWLSKQRK